MPVLRLGYIFGLMFVRVSFGPDAGLFAPSILQVSKRSSGPLELPTTRQQGSLELTKIGAPVSLIGRTSQRHLSLLCNPTRFWLNLELLPAPARIFRLGALWNTSLGSVLVGRQDAGRSIN